jgi:hypothetical protein
MLVGAQFFLGGSLTHGYRGIGVFQISDPTPLNIDLVVLCATKKKKGYKGVNMADVKFES